MNLMQVGFTVAGALVCLACVGALALLLTWRERAATPPERRWRLMAVVLPASGVLLALVLWTLLHVMLLWAPSAAAAVAAR